MINEDIRNMIDFQHSDLKVQTREDKNILFSVGTDEEAGGPNWDNVRVRETYDAFTGCMIEFLVIHPWDRRYMKERLPMGVVHTKPILRYENPNGVKRI